MPELPEVETIVQSLIHPPGEKKLSILGVEITDVLIRWEGILANQTPERFIECVKRQSLRTISRRGKFIVLTLSEDTILIHLRMSGDLRVESRDSGPNEELPLQKHDRMALIFANRARLAFNNPRKFGRVWLLADPDEVLGKLGPEPLDDAMDSAAFHAMLIKHKRQLKPLLMDQHFLAGMGNIYTDEALFLSRLHPLMRSNLLTKAQSALLLKSIRSVLKESIRRNGASIDWVYRGGGFQDHFNVYGRKGEPCVVCGTPIERLLVGQRGTHICPHCQKM
ncbi:MAG: bifunctional DNA-formamidopyrimidine glycosylase/DNA-(apurinic or apyrimidinic site) lyase [Anaerolineaceae bacterium]|nr:bifunctional DNA-formamidopyrimidine glycosylase/DNA-(apurinic or apyrimidinic site) lyase [Anaerolineaceae bacterium]